MENILERVKTFVNQEINSRSNISGDFVQGYKIAMIDVKDFIDFRENENKLIGKWGYFWNYNEISFCLYGKLKGITDQGYYMHHYFSDVINYENFSLDIPKHLK